MKFTDRFIKLHIKVFDTSIKELTGKCTYEDAWMKIIPEEISQYKPSEDEDNDNLECVSIRMKNGDSFYAYMSVEKFERTLNNHYEKCLTV